MWTAPEIQKRAISCHTSVRLQRFIYCVAAASGQPERLLRKPSEKNIFCQRRTSVGAKLLGDLNQKNFVFLTCSTNAIFKRKVLL